MQPRSDRAMATGWLAAARPAILPAIGIAIVAVTSCVLPSYSVGGTTSSSAAGGGASTGPGVGGAGGAGQSSSDSASVGPGGSGIGGSGIGGDLTMCDPSSTHETITSAPTPHGVTVAKHHVAWIQGNNDVVYYANRGAMHAPTALLINDVCGITSIGTASGDRVVMRQRDGSISFSPLPGGITPAFGPTAAPLGDAACAISAAANGDVYGFDVNQSGVYSLVRYELSPPKQTTVIAAMGAPVAIDATNDREVAWVEALNGLGAFYTASKTSGQTDADIPGSFTDVCAYGQQGRFAFTAPDVAAIDTWSIKSGPSFLTQGVRASWIACNGKHRVWIEYNDGCATLKQKDAMTAATKTIATKQPRACSIAVAGDTVYWTNCEPSGGVFAASL